MKDVSTVGLDIAKSVFQAHAVSSTGAVRCRKKLYRGEVLEFFRKLSPCVVGMEACSGSHYWAREIRALGHEVKLMPPQYVKPYVKRNKNDRADAEAICEAVRRPTMRFVPIKDLGAQELSQVHAVRERVVRARTALSNEIHGIFGEYGVILPKGVEKLVTRVHVAVSEEKEKIPPLASQMLERMAAELLRLNEEVKFYTEKIEAIHKAHPVSQALESIQGVGAIGATAAVARMGEAGRFKNGRQYAASLGLTPKEHSSGSKTRLGRISKQGDGYLRKILVQGACAVIRHVEKRSDPRSEWIKRLVARRGKQKATVALANKNARIIWVIMMKGGKYDISLAHERKTPERKLMAA